MVQILGAFHEFSFSMISGLFGIVAKIYDIMLDLVRTGSIDTSPFDDFVTTMYVLAGVFMLFRVVIGMIQMLINPDQMTDKQAGAGKLITRIVVSIVMLMLFVPNGIIFGEDGIFQRVEQALLAEDGLVSRLSGMNFDEDLSSPITKEGTAKFLIENVYAEDVYTCYYYKIEVDENNGIIGSRTIRIDDYYKISFSKTKKNDGKRYKKVENSDDWYFYSANSNEKVANLEYNGKGGLGQKEGDPVKYTKLSKLKVKNIKATNSGKNKTYYGKNSNFNKCPPAIVDNFARKGSAKYSAGIGTSTEYPTVFVNGGLYGGATSVKGMIEHANKVMKAHDSVIGTHYVANTDKIDTPDDPVASGNYLINVGDDAIVFAQGTASSLQECASGYEDDCKEAQTEMFTSSEGNEKIVNLMDQKHLDIGFIMSMITGLGLIVYLLFLCVEIFIRKLKLYFLKIIAPIPIISYVDPKDKVFNQWTKMYLSTYVDLFIKLISIGIAVTLLDAIFKGDFWSESNLLMKFFEIVAILVFAKILPTMVSKLFGLDSMGGSFKDIMGMAKGAAGFAVGGALGAGAGMLATGAGIASAKGVKGKLGAGLQGLGNIASGTIKGAGAGSKGKIGTGASGVLATGKRQRDARAQGATMMGMLGSRMANTLGFDDAYTKEKDAVDKLKRKKSNTSGALSSIKTFNDTVESNMRNKSGAKGYENLAEVQTWRQAKAALESAKQSGNADDIYKAEQAEQTAFKHAFDAAKDEELNRIAGLESRDTDGKLVKFSADEKARSSINAYDRYNSELGENAQINSKALDHSTLGQTKDNLTRIESTQQTEITTRETALEESKIKAEHDAVQRGKQ